jgi:hypothetical protein
MAITIEAIVEKYRDVLSSRTLIRSEMEPAAEITKDPLISIRHLPPAKRTWISNDLGTGKVWFREISLVVFLAAEGSNGKGFRKAMAAQSEKVAALYDNEDDGGDFPLNEDGAWFSTWRGKKRPGEPLAKSESEDGTWKWNEAWDVTLYVPENAFNA